MGFKQHISRTWQMIEQQVNDVPFRPHHEASGLKNHAVKSIFCRFAAKNAFALSPAMV